MKPPKTIYVHKYAAHIFAEKEDRSNTVEYSLKGEELKSLKRWVEKQSFYTGSIFKRAIILELERRLK